ncbi:Rho GTPase activation protein [Laetiporus sulphureus 93-53]|uniref:Rho GTPase activation protein n=1 Tax=Laetiporus sulphureus 93-53 TaxID=1314785 RepID=A0A165FLT1_9APHY|nr:Rho GTPase activation protein [Laetiporus sulphureus 93-53]KZT09163.1 Rho GTPase activation protein [Laetiporus sulphureus 93-53]
MGPNVAALKQRLASFAQARSDTPLSSKRRTFAGPPLRTRAQDAQTGLWEYRDDVQDVMSKVIFQAGVDYETRPMVVMNASVLPDPREIDYDILLSRILSYLDLYVESDYTVVFFAAGGRYTPGWSWVWKAYRSLSRKYRKNLKKLFIVHSTFFTKMLFSLAGTIISPKFYRKITYINTLSELACYIPLTQIDIPPAVYKENLKHEKQIQMPMPTRADLFGVPLEELMGYDGEKGGLPRVVKDCIQYLRSTGMQDEGLFRRSPNSVLLKQVQQAYDRGQVVSLDTFGDPHLAAVLLKKYLRDLPVPLFPEDLYAMISRCPAPTDDTSDMSSITYIRETLLPELPHCSYIVLSHVLQLLHDVSLRSSVNRMDAQNLAVVITPNFVSGSNPLRDVMMCSTPSGMTPFASSPFSPTNPTMGKTTLGMLIKHCIQRYYEVFDEVPDRSEAVMQSAFQVRPSTPSSPSSPTKTRHREPMHEDEDIDDTMLVMPVGPLPATNPGSHSHSSQPPPVPSRPRDLSKRAKEAPTAWSARTVGQSGKGPNANGSTYTPYGTVNKARSTISIERGNPSRKGSISVGRGTSRKASGAGVEAVGITAAGFFAAPETAPPVPMLPSQIKANGGHLPSAS